MRFVGRGDTDIRATHAKTIEITAATDITGRATCVIAVAARDDDPGPLAGPVEITITCRGESATVHARANSSWDPAGSAVIRRSPLRLPGTLATHADAAAADLPRALVAAVQDPDAVVEVAVESAPDTGDTVVLFAADPLRPDDPRLRAELAAADVVVAEDAGARALVRARGGPADGGRILVVATRELPGASLDPGLRAGAGIETVGLSARLAAAAASPISGPVTFAPGDAGVRELLRTTPASHRLVLSSEAGRLPALLALAAEIRGRADGVLAQEFAPPIRVVAGRHAELPSQDLLHLCLDAAGGAAGGADGALDPTVRAAISHLLADGVSTRTAARALADLTGWPRRRAYDAVLALIGGS